MKMRFQARLITRYSVLVVLLVVILGIAFYSYSARLFQSTASNNLTVIAETTSQQLDNLIRPMDFVVAYLLSSGEFMSSLSNLSNLDHGDPRNLRDINEGWRTINSALLGEAINKNFYSVNVFDRRGDFLSSNVTTHAATPDVLATLPATPWIARADAALGGIVILAPYIDPWSSRGVFQVYGIARSVQGPTGGIGYVEVQNPRADLERLFSVPDADNITVMALTENGELFFKNQVLDTRVFSYYAELVRSTQGAVVRARNRVTGQEEIVAGRTSTYTGITVVLAKNWNALLRPLIITRNATFLIAALIIVVSLLYTYLSSRQLVRPLRQLTRAMEATGLKNLPERLTFQSSNDEIEALTRSFQGLRERLNEAVGREIRSESLQMQARLDSLQAQVDPHFIYNILNVISSRGMEAGDEQIGEICGGIASLLRYSTSTTTRTATVGEEMEHVRTYLSLMKRRFEHRLETSVNSDPAIFDEPIPKIVLQPVVENSITHGYTSSQKVMRISVRGIVLDGRWYVEMSDDGRGFDTHALEELRERIEETRILAGEQGVNFGLGIGGMGLTSTCARLALFYGTHFLFTLENTAEGGARVTIGAPLSSSGRAPTGKA